MSKLSVNPLVLGVGAFVVATAGSSVLAADLDQALDTSALDDSLLTIAGADSHEGEGECGEKDEEGKCGEGQCGEDDDGGEEEEGEDEEEEA